MDEMVVYETLYDNPNGRLWVRPKKMFFENVEKDGKTVPRFASIKPVFKTKNQVGSDEIEKLKPLIERIFGRFDAEDFQGVIANHTGFHLILAEIDQKPVGFKLGYTHDQNIFYSWMGGVDPDFRALGLGSELIELQHHWAKEKGFKKIKTKTKNKWKEMLILNLKSGFKVVGTYIDSKGESKIMLEKSLL